MISKTRPTSSFAKVRSAAEARIAYLVFRTYDLHPSEVPELPDSFQDVHRWIDEVRRANPDATFGWSAHRPDPDATP